MKIGAVIAEFNPFHTGHKYLIDQIRKECDGVIAVMSGNFVQRGECSIFDKTERARIAAGNGVDLVIELPTTYALSSAENFATGAVRILNLTGIVNNLYFGSECGNIDTLSAVAEIFNNETTEFKEALLQKLSEGFSFPASRRYALEAVHSDASVIDTPNNTLAIEYIRALKKTSSAITPHTIKRMGSGYNDTQIKESFASASALRALLKKGENPCDYLPGSFCSSPVFMEHFDMAVAAKVKTFSKEELCLVPDCTIDIASRIKDSSHFNTFYEIVEAAVCKSYTQSRIRRILCNLLIGNKFSSPPLPDYIRPLAFNKTGSEILRKMKSTASQKIIARGALIKDNPLFLLECRATDIYNLARGKKGGEEFSFVPIFIDND